MTKDSAPHDDRFTSPMTVIIGEHAPWVSPYDKMLQSTGDADFKESDHPRGQPDNAGQFAKGSGGSSSKANPKSSNRLLQEYEEMNAAALELDPFTREGNEAAWKAVKEKQQEYRESLERESNDVPPGKVIKRPKPPTEDKAKDYAIMYPEEFKEESGMWSTRERMGEHPSQRLKAVSDVRTAIMGLPESHRNKLAATTVKNTGTIPSDMKMTVKRAEKGSGWAGMYKGSEDTAYIVDFVATDDGREFALEDISGTTVHELGHALDHKINLSGAGYFQEGVNADMKDLTEPQRKAAEYYLQAYTEMTAECYNMCFSNSGRAFGMPKSEAWEVFKNTRERLGALLQQKGLDVYAGILAT